MPRRPRSQSSTPSPDEAESLFADLLDDEMANPNGAAKDAGDAGGMGNSGIPPAIAYQPASGECPATALDDPDLPYWLALNRVKRHRPGALSPAAGGFGSARNAWEAEPSGLAGGGTG